MGHYEDAFEYDKSEEDKAVRKALKKELRERIKKLSLDELHFMETIVNNVGEYRTFFRIIKDGVGTSW